jgi:sugar phosphate permease|tara:strand:- start:1493 stop:2761 length:1269 start_codon:yes stop_codon:yes gene_type:complete
LAATGLGNFVAASVAGVVLGGIQGLIVQDTRWSRTTIGFSASVGVWMSGVVAPVAGRLADRYGPRWLMPIGTILLGLCLYALGGVTTVWQFFVLAVLGRAISQPLLIGIVPRTLAVNFFLERRNLALAFIGIFRPVNAAINIQAISIIAVNQGWRTAFRYLGILSFILTIPLALVIRRRPEEIGLLPDGARVREEPSALPGQPQPGTGVATAARPANLGNEPQEHPWSAREALRTRAYWLVATTAFLGTTANTTIGFNIVPYLVEEAGITTTQAAGVLSLGTVLSLGNLGWGYLADRITPRWCVLAAMVTSAASVLFLFQVNSVLSAYIFGIVWGLSSGTSGVLISMIVAQYFGRTNYGSIGGTLRPFEAGGLGLGQSLGAVIYDIAGSYSLLVWTALCAHLLGGIFIILARAPAPPQGDSR